MSTIKEFTDDHYKFLEPDMDFREPKYRKEVFMCFYEYHLRLKAHPGCVYFIFPYLWKRFNFTQEQKLWWCYLNGVTQNPLTTWAIYSRFPDFDKIDLEKMEEWHSKNWRKLDYDTDRRYQKGHLVEMVKNYKEHIGGKTQQAFFAQFTVYEDPELNFPLMWDYIKKNFREFGRLSTFSYMEYLRIAGVGVEPPTLFLEDMDGSLSHRNGILKVYGRDDLEQHKTINPGVKHDKEIVKFAIEKGEELLQTARQRFKDKDFFADVNYFTLESTLCTFKSWFRVDRRYPNVYIDMMWDRMTKAATQGLLSEKDIQIFDDCRKECLPVYALTGGVSKWKQNYFRETGKILFLGNMFPLKFGESEC